jgi:Ulp1 family protease
MTGVRFSMDGKSVFKSDWGYLTKTDIQKLEPGAWANDEIVNFGIK